MLSTDLSKRHSSFALRKHFTITLFLLRPQATPSSHLVPRSGRKAATLLRVAPSRFFRRAWHGEAPASRLPVLLRRASGRRRATLLGLCRLRQSPRVNGPDVARGTLRIRFTAGSGIQPAMVRAHFRACALSVMPGNSRRAQWQPRTHRAARAPALSPPCSSSTERTGNGCPKG
jgi:hypothetical protein